MLNKEMTLAQVVRATPAAARVLEHHHLAVDDRTILEAASAAGLCGCELAQALELAADPSRRGLWDLSEAQLIQDILDTHHAFLRQALPAGSRLLDDAREQARDAKALEPLIEVFEVLRDELEQHMLKEERVLFPMIGQLAQGLPITFGCGHVDGPIAQMELEHDAVKQALRQFKAMRAAGVLGKTGLDEATAQRIDAYLQRLHDDLVLHIYKENQVLFPRVRGTLTVATAP